MYLSPQFIPALKDGEFLRKKFKIEAITSISDNVDRKLKTANDDTIGCLDNSSILSNVIMISPFHVKWQSLY
jgi:hypothetical protein